MLVFSRYHHQLGSQIPLGLGPGLPFSLSVSYGLQTNLVTYSSWLFSRRLRGLTQSGNRFRFRFVFVSCVRAGEAKRRGRVWGECFQRWRPGRKHFRRAGLARRCPSRRHKGFQLFWSKVYYMQWFYAVGLFWLRRCKGLKGMQLRKP